MSQKNAGERELRISLGARDDLKHFEKAWQEIESAQQVKAELLERTIYIKSRYFNVAQQLVLMAGEDEKPNEERFQEFRDSGRESLEHRLYSPAPIYDDLEIVELAASLSMLAGSSLSSTTVAATALGRSSSAFCPNTRASE